MISFPGRLFPDYKLLDLWVSYSWKLNYMCQPHW